jgi:hypothetical protein
MAEVKKQYTRNVGPALFKDSFFQGEKGTQRKAFALPVAIIVHAAFIITLITMTIIIAGSIVDISDTTSVPVPACDALASIPPVCICLAGVLIPMP